MFQFTEKNRYVVDEFNAMLAETFIEHPDIIRKVPEKQRTRLLMGLFMFLHSGECTDYQKYLCWNYLYHGELECKYDEDEEEFTIFVYEFCNFYVEFCNKVFSKRVMKLYCRNMAILALQLSQIEAQKLIGDDMINIEVMHAAIFYRLNKAEPGLDMMIEKTIEYITH